MDVQNTPNIHAVVEAKKKGGTHWVLENWDLMYLMRKSAMFSVPLDSV
jgi:hypothetical protein